MSARDYDRVCLYTDKAGKTRWRYRAAGNSRILADSGQGYRHDDDAIDAACRVTGGRWSCWDAEATFLLGDDDWILFVDERVR